MKINWKKIFDWEIVYISKPAPEFYEYSDIGKTFLGYCMTIHYQHHGNRKVFFAVDAEKLGLCKAGKAYNRAQKYYKKRYSKIWPEYSR